MKRYEVVPVIGTGTMADPIRPNVAGMCAVVAYHPSLPRALVKRPEVDGTAVAAQTIADLDTTNRAVAVTATALNQSQQNTIKAWLTAQGFDISQFDTDGVNDRQKLLGFIARRVMQTALTDQLLVEGFDVA